MSCSVVVCIAPRPLNTMKAAVHSELDLTALDAFVSEHPFAKATYILTQLRVCYERRLTKIAGKMRIAERVLAELASGSEEVKRRAIGDTVLRCAVQHSLRQLETGEKYGLPLEQCEAIFSATVDYLRSGKIGLLTSHFPNCVGSSSYHPRLWSINGSGNEFARAFETLIRNNYGGELHSPSSEEVSMLSKGVRLLEILLPQSARGALHHVQVVALFQPGGPWKTTASSSQFKLSGTIFMSRRFISDPWWVAEHILHEALHQQMYDFRHGHTLLRDDCDRADAPKVRSLWNLPNGNLWDSHRTLAAFHVYVYLTLFGLIAEQRVKELEDEFGRAPAGFITGSMKSMQRATYLGSQIKSTIWDEFGPAGKKYVEFFANVLEIISNNPPPPGCRLHLLLDRYAREGRILQSLLTSEMRRPDLAMVLDMLAEREIRTAKAALELARPGSDRSRLDGALHAIATGDRGAQFGTIRQVLLGGISEVLRDGYVLSDDSKADDIVGAMIESSSEDIRQLLN